MLCVPAQRKRLCAFALCRMNASPVSSPRTRGAHFVCKLKAAGTGVYHIRAGDQSQNRQGTGPHNSAISACPCRRGDRIAMRFAAVRCLVLTA